MLPADSAYDFFEGMPTLEHFLTTGHLPDVCECDACLEDAEHSSECKCRRCGIEEATEAQ